MTRKIYEYTITTDDPYYLHIVYEQIEAGYYAGYVDHANYWERHYIGDNEDDED